MRRLAKLIPHIPVVWVLLTANFAFANIQTSSGDPKSISETLYKIIENKNVKTAVKEYHHLKKTHPSEYDFSEPELNDLGYRLIREKRFKAAVEIMKLNLEMFAESANAHDSLAEAYQALGKHTLSEKYYKAALRIDPEFQSPQAGLRRHSTIAHYVKKEVMVPMRDGVRLFTQIYTPRKKSEKVPFLYMHTPYGVAPYGTNPIRYRNTLGPNQRFTKEGYIFVYQDARGKYASEGEFMQMRPLGDEISEATDIYDTIEWLLENVEGHNGRVGMWGISYPGVYAAMGLVNAHPALKAVSPQAPPSDWFMGDDWHHNGAFFWFQCVNWMRGSGVYRPEPTKEFPGRLFTYPTPRLYDFFLDVGPVANINNHYFRDKVPFWNQMMEHGSYDDFWKARSTLPHFNNVTAHVLNVGGWFDAENLYGALKTYRSIEEKNPENHSTLVMGPWYHGGWAWSATDMLGDVDVKSGTAAAFFQETIEFPFFNTYLKDKGKVDLPEAMIFEMGTNVWKEYDVWPPANAVTKTLYFQPGEAASFTPPETTEENGFETYISDPDRPVPHDKDQLAGWGYDFMHDDQRFAAIRPDVLVFRTEPLEETVTIAGPIEAELFVSTTGTDADWVVKVIDVFPDSAARNSENTWMGGYQMLVRGDIIRGKFRNSYETPEPFVPGEVTRVAFTLPDVCYAFLPGHRIMIQVQSSWFPLVDRNPQKFMNIYEAEEADFQTAEHRVYFTEDHPSGVQFHVVK